MVQYWEVSSIVKTHVTDSHMKLIWRINSCSSSIILFWCQPYSSQKTKKYFILKINFFTKKKFLYKWDVIYLSSLLDQICTFKITHHTISQSKTKHRKDCTIVSLNYFTAPYKYFTLK